MISHLNVFWVFLIVLLCFDMPFIWIMFKSEKWRKVRRFSLTPILLIFITPFVDQPNIFGNILWQLSGIVFLLLGLAIMVLGGNEFRKLGIISALARKESPKFQPEQISHKLVTTGVYKIFRHPQYIGLIVFFIGYSWVFNALYSLYLTPLIIAVFIVVAFVEEKYDLEVIFGDEYREYKKKVGMFLPKIHRKGQ